MNSARPAADFFLRATLAILAAFGTGLPQAVADPPARPNIVVILVDDMGVMDSSVPYLNDASGKPQRFAMNERYRTPHMERLSRQGIRFSQFYAMSVCSPSRISMLTGQNAARHRTTNWIDPDRNNGGPQGPSDWNWRGLGPESVTLPRLLQSAGYRTIHVGKGHLGPRDAPGADPRAVGFDVNVAGASIGHPGSYFGKQDFGARNPNPTHAVPGLEAYHGQDIFLTEALTREALTQVQDAVEHQRPFFLHLAHYAVHAPFQLDPRFAEGPGRDAWSAPARAFASLIEGVDQSLGEVLDGLERLGVAENTLVVFLGDNGSDAPLGEPHAVACAAPLRGKKGSHYEGGMRVPFLAAWARPDPQSSIQQRFPILPGATQTQIAAIYDLFPTLLELASLPPPEHHPLDGKSLWNLFQGLPDETHSDEFLMHYPHAVHRSNYFTVFRRGNEKLVYHYFPDEFAEGRRVQWFDLAKDPFEQDDRAAEEPDRVRNLMQRMSEKLAEQSALFPVDPASGKPILPALPTSVDNE